MGEARTESAGELKSLTSLRGIAALAVAMNHFAATAQTHCRVTIPAIPPHGYVAVDFFFVLSGFIMAYTYLESFQRLGLKAFGPFLAKRAARIVPLNVTALALVVVTGMLSTALIGRDIIVPPTDNLPFDIMANLLMLQGLGIGTNLNGPSWSISVEFAAYLLFPVFLVAAFWSRYTAILSAVIAAAGITLLAMSAPHLTLADEAMPNSVIRCFTEFTLGLMAYRMYRTPRITAILERDDVTLLLSLIAAGSLIARYDLPAVLMFPFLVVSYASNTGLIARIVQARPIYFLGVISFSLYLLHNLFRPVELLILKTLSPDPVGPVVALTFAVLGALSTIPFAWVAYTAVEKPGRTLIRHLFASGGAKSRPPTLGPAA